MTTQSSVLDEPTNPSAGNGEPHSTEGSAGIAASPAFPASSLVPVHPSSQPPSLPRQSGVNSTTRPKETADEFGNPVGDAERESARLQAAISSEESKRATVGYISGALGVTSVIAVLVYSTWSINETVDKYVLDRGFLNPLTPQAAWLVLASIIVHGVVSVAAVYFGYSMLKASERLFVPQRLLKDVKDVELVRAVLGIDAPTDAIAGKLKTMSSEANALLKAISELVRAAQGGSGTNEKRGE